VKLLTIQIDACPTAGGVQHGRRIYDSGEDLWQALPVVLSELGAMILSNLMSKLGVEH
jgi:hypothetical protein